MMYNYNDDYQYDSCVSRGICSINPRTSSLQEVLVLYLKLTSYYAQKLYNMGVKDKEAKKIIIDTISIMVSNPEFSENDFEALTSAFNRILLRLIKLYEKTCDEKNETIDYLKTVLKLDTKIDIIKSIQLGEKEFLEKTKSLNNDIRDLYKILFVLTKSMCINILELESFDYFDEEAYVTILSILNSLNSDLNDKEELKKLIKDVAKKDNDLSKQLRLKQEERYGQQRENEVSYSTFPSKAILVVGSNIRELEDILEAVKNTEIDIYTHDEMMLANTFPKFSEYKNLKGQYGQGIENCLLDFATFPGPIILTRHSLYNVEHLYRGRLYTTDVAYSKGVIPIKNKDFTKVISAANDSKGFKRGKQCESIKLGYQKYLVEEELKSKIKDFSQLIILGHGGYTLEQRTYFDKLKSQTPKDILVLGLSGNFDGENVINVNACFDSLAIVLLTEYVRKISEIPIALYFPECDRHTMSQMIFLKEIQNVKVLVGKCTPILLNPNLITALENDFEIKAQTTVKKDLEYIIDKK